MLSRGLPVTSMVDQAGPKYMWKSFFLKKAVKEKKIKWKTNKKGVRGARDKICQNSSLGKSGDLDQTWPTLEATC